MVQANSPPDRAQILAVLSALRLPDGSPLSSERIGGLVLRGDTVGFALDTAGDDPAIFEPLRLACETALLTLPGITHAQVVLTAERIQDSAASPARTANRSISSAAYPPSNLPPQGGEALTPSFLQTAQSPSPLEGEGRGGGKDSRSKPVRPTPQVNHAPIPGVARIIAVASGKGGVGKSSLTVLLAHALVADGVFVGILDADLYGPSIPRMLGLSGQPEVQDGKMLPLTAHGIACNSMGFLTPADAALAWRGPMISKALHQLARGTDWTGIQPIDSKMQTAAGALSAIVKDAYPPSNLPPQRGEVLTPSSPQRPQTPSPLEGEGRGGGQRQPRKYAAGNIRLARSMRQNPTDAERALWKLLRQKQLEDHKFRRQQPIGPYIADFLCPSACLIVEADGGQHDAEIDRERTRYLTGQGYRILRFWNHDILQNPEGIWQQIAQTLTPPPNLPPQGGEGITLLVDLPPGTGDVHLSMLQQLPIDGAVIVTTPQAVAVDDARKAAAMFTKVNIPILGIVENMVYFTDPAGQRHTLFGEGGADRLAQESGSEVRARLPLDPALGRTLDRGLAPTIENGLDGVRGLARSLVAAGNR